MRSTLHFANGTATQKRPLLLYTTGDGGWARKDLALYRQISRGDIRPPGSARPTTSTTCAERTAPRRRNGSGRDYADIIAFAETNLDVEPDTPVVLIGVSRGAGLEVVAAGQPQVRDKLAGVVAIALTREEEYVRWFGRLPLLHRPQERVMVQVYEYLPLLGTVPIAVIQSTHDHFLPAAAAAQLFGADTPTRRFRAIEAQNHSFGGARDEMYQACKEALDWILDRASYQGRVLGFYGSRGFRVRFEGFRVVGFIGFGFRSTTALRAIAHGTNLRRRTSNRVNLEPEPRT